MRSETDARGPFPESGVSLSRVLNTYLRPIEVNVGTFSLKEWPYRIVTANKLTFLVDPEKPVLQPGESIVYPYHEEAGDMLEIYPTNSGLQLMGVFGNFL